MLLKLTGAYNNKWIIYEQSIWYQTVPVTSIKCYFMPIIYFMILKVSVGIYRRKTQLF